MMMSYGWIKEVPSCCLYGNGGDQKGSCHVDDLQYVVAGLEWVKAEVVQVASAITSGHWQLLRSIDPIERGEIRCFPVFRTNSNNFCILGVEFNVARYP